MLSQPLPLPLAISPSSPSLPSPSQSLKTFLQNFNNLPPQIKNNRYYIGLLLIALVSTTNDMREYIEIVVEGGGDVNFCEPAQGELGAEQGKMEEQNGETKGKSVFMVACQKSCYENVKYLMKYEQLEVGYTDSQGNNAIYYTINNQSQKQSIKILSLIIPQFPHLITPPSGYNPLFHCISTSKSQILHYLLTSSSLSPNCQQPSQNFIGNFSKKSQLAHQQKQLSISSTYLNSHIGMTALHYLLTLNDQLKYQDVIEMAEILLENGADPQIKDFFGENCYEYGEKYLFMELGELVSKIGKNIQKQAKGNKCYTRCTYADSRTAFSKQEQKQIYQQQQFQQKPQSIHQQQPIPSQQLFQFCSQLDYSQPIQMQQAQPQTKPEPEPQAQAQSFHSKLSTILHNHSVPPINFHKYSMEVLNGFFQYLRQVGICYGLLVQLVGSFGTGLWTIYSDVDVVFVNTSVQYRSVHTILQQIYQHIQSHPIQNYTIHNTYLNLTEYPNIKLSLSAHSLSTCPFSTNQPYTINLSIFQKKCTSLKYTQYINQCLYAYPQIRVLYFCFYWMLEKWGINGHFYQGVQGQGLEGVQWEFGIEKGNKLGKDSKQECVYKKKRRKQGIKSYTLFLLLLSQIPSMANEPLSVQFAKISNFYSTYPYPVSSSPPFKPILSIIDPLNAHNNAGGRDTDVQRFALMMKSLGYGLKVAETENENENENGEDGEDEDIMGYLGELSRMFV